jgi:hypothetical protein
MIHLFETSHKSIHSAAFMNFLLFVKDGKARSATLVCAFLMYVNLFSKPEDAAQMFAVKRMPPGLHPSEMR